MIGNLDQPKAGTEAGLLGALRTEYEVHGFVFVTEPDVAALPPFLSGNRPDAVALAPGRNVAIVVKRRWGSHEGSSAAAIQRVLADKPDWSLRVVVPASDPLDAVVIPGADPRAVEQWRADLLALAHQGQRRAAFVMAWALLEAAFRARDGAATGRAQSPGAVVQALATMGSIEPETERRLRSLLELRNRVVHGDLAAEPDGGEVEAVLSAVAEAMRDAA